eukprot:CFRG1204T1
MQSEFDEGIEYGPDGVPYLVDGTERSRGHSHSHGHTKTTLSHARAKLKKPLKLTDIVRKAGSTNTASNNSSNETDGRGVGASESTGVDAHPNENAFVDEGVDVHVGEFMSDNINEYGGLDGGEDWNFDTSIGSVDYDLLEESLTDEVDSLEQNGIPTGACDGTATSAPMVTEAMYGALFDMFTTVTHLRTPASLIRRARARTHGRTTDVHTPPPTHSAAKGTLLKLCSSSARKKASRIKARVVPNPMSLIHGCEYGRISEKGDDQFPTAYDCLLIIQDRKAVFCRHVLPRHNAQNTEVHKQTESLLPSPNARVNTSGNGGKRKGAKSRHQNTKNARTCPLGDCGIYYKQTYAITNSQVQQYTHPPSQSPPQLRSHEKRAQINNSSTPSIPSQHPSRLALRSVTDAYEDGSHERSFMGSPVDDSPYEVLPHTDDKFLDIANLAMDEAWIEPNMDKRKCLARAALDMSPKCETAYILLGEEATTSVIDCAKYMRAAIYCSYARLNRSGDPKVISNNKASDPSTPTPTPTPIPTPTPTSKTTPTPTPTSKHKNKNNSKNNRGGNRSSNAHNNANNKQTNINVHGSTTTDPLSYAHKHTQVPTYTFARAYLDQDDKTFTLSLPPMLYASSLHGYYREACTLFEALIELYPGVRESHLSVQANLMECYWALGEYDRVREVLNAYEAEIEGSGGLAVAVFNKALLSLVDLRRFYLSHARLRTTGLDSNLETDWGASASGSAATKNDNERQGENVDGEESTDGWGELYNGLKWKDGLTRNRENGRTRERGECDSTFLGWFSSKCMRATCSCPTVLEQLCDAEGYNSIVTDDAYNTSGHRLARTKSQLRASGNVSGNASGSMVSRSWWERCGGLGGCMCDEAPWTVKKKSNNHIHTASKRGTDTNAISAAKEQETSEQSNTFIRLRETVIANMTAAVAFNPHVPIYLLLQRSLVPPPEHFVVRGVSEAVAYAFDYVEHWARVPGALSLLSTIQSRLSSLNQEELVSQSRQKQMEAMDRNLLGEQPVFGMPWI